MRTRTALALFACLFVPLVAAGGTTHPAPASMPTAYRVDALDHEPPPSTTAPSTTTLAPATTTTTTVEVTTTAPEPPTTTEVEAQATTSSRPRPRPTTSAAPVTEPATTVPATTTTPEAPPETTTVVTEAPAPAPGPLCTSVYGSPAPEWLAGAISAAGWPGDQMTNVCKIAGCESNFHPTSHGSSGVYGLMQVMARSLPWSTIMAAHGWSRDDLYDPVVNLTVAHEGWAQMGSAWSSSQWSCTYALRR